jgi:hypothetical protein
MPQQLIYTSAPQGVDAGRSGYCTVARSSSMGESLVQRLEQLSYYERLSEHGGEAERTVYSCRIIDIRGKTYHVLSRIKDAPADYTGRTNFIAHHLVFTPDEVVNMPTPTVLLNHWSGWKDQWEQEPTLFANESWTELNELKELKFLPAKHWHSKTGDHGRAAGLLGLNAGVFIAPDFKPKLILDLLSESLELLQLEGPNWRSLAWQRTFSVGCQPQDNPADFRWRFLTSNLPFESSGSQSQAPMELTRLRAPSNSRQVQFAQKGPSAPQFMRLPRAGEALQINEDEPLILDGEALSLPGPIIYRWYRVEKDNVTEQEIDGAHNAKLEDRNIPRGKNRYMVKAWDAVTGQFNKSHLIVVEVSAKVVIPSFSGRPPSPSGNVPPWSRATKPASRLEIDKTTTSAKRPYENRLTDRGEPDEKLHGTFLRRHSNTIAILGVLFFLCVIAWSILNYLDLFEPHHKGHYRDWWALKVMKNPGHFKESKRISEGLRKEIREDPNPNPKRIKHWLKVVEVELKDYSPTNSSQTTAKGGPTKPLESQPENPGKQQPKEPVKKSSAPIHVILANNEWAKLIALAEPNLKGLKDNQSKAEEKRNKGLEEEKNADKKLQEAEKNKNNNNSPTNRDAQIASDELKKAKTKVSSATNDRDKLGVQINSLESNINKLRKREEEARKLQLSNLWPYFDTNQPPKLRWSELGQKQSESGNTVNGEWRTNHWHFEESQKWTLKINQSGAEYTPTNQTKAILVDIAEDPVLPETTQRLRILLVSKANNNGFQATLDGDDLKPSAELEETLNSISSSSAEYMRVIGSYPGAKTPMSHKLSEIKDMIAKKQPWKLGIKAQLTDDMNKAQAFRQQQKALNNVETFWKKVYDADPIPLGREREFTKAVDDSIRAAEAYWKKVDLMCSVAIYSRERSSKFNFVAWTKDDAKKELDKFMNEENNDKYKEDLDKLTDDLPHVKEFWNKTTKEPGWAAGYKELKTKLGKEIENLEKDGGKIIPANLKVELQFNTWATNWITITALNCQ